MTAEQLADTICWECANANGNGCGWFRRHSPVPGWTAEKSFIGDNEDFGESFRVLRCPEFERGKAARKK
ncbi:MAG: hypothetical protein FWC55_10205 [Firmicutes bacterium]|nr:hypothetical protein [Bacillota bacterium]